MKKSLNLSLIASLFFLLGAQVSKAQSFQQGNSIISLGYGFPNFDAVFLKSFSANDINFKTTGIGPAHLKYEYALSDKIGVGMSINYSGTTSTWQAVGDVYDANHNVIGQTTYNYTFKTTNIAFNPRLNIHFATTDKVDPYWGIGVGFKSKNYTFSSDDPNYTGDSVKGIPVGFETTFGCRFYFTPNIGAYTELGLSRSLIQAGLVAKF